MMRVIDIAPGNRASTRRVILAGQEFVIALRWSDFEGCFYMSIGDANGNAIVRGIRVVSNLPLLSPYTLDRLPRGELSVLDSSPSPTDPTLSSLGERHTLVFIPIPELA